MEEFLTALEKRLSEMADSGYRDFQLGLIPGIQPETMVGVRTPQLRRLASELRKSGQGSTLLEALPHGFYEENILHGLLLSQLSDYEETVAELERFLPYVDNWAVCDLLSPRAFRSRPHQLPEQIQRWMGSSHPYTIRFGLGMLMSFYLDEPYFDPKYLSWAMSVPTGEYYVDMMAAWYFATALAKQYDAVLPLLQERKLDRWVHNKTIQKAVESRRITEEQKTFLRPLRWKA